MPAVSKFVYLSAKPERREELVAHLNKVRLETKAEAGTEQWILFDVAGQPNSVAMYEVYTDEAASDSHDLNSALQNLLPELAELLSDEALILELIRVASREDD